MNRRMSDNGATKQTRRHFLRQTSAAAAATATATAAAAPAPAHGGHDEPWYRRTLRWGQTNITETDPADYDIAWWRAHWKRTRVQGVIINAGGIVAYYPSKYPLQYRPPALGDRDLFGELTTAAHADGLVVFARMDSNRAHEDFYRAQPDWFARNADGEPYRAGGLYVTCVNSPYYDEYLPGVLREIIARYHPEGFTDNSWSGLDRNSICYCDHCQRKFRQRSGKPIPQRKDWDDPVWRDWIAWNYERRLEVWDQNNRVTREAGGVDCIWAGMNSASLTSQAARFRDLKEIGRRAAIIMLDHQARRNETGFQENGEAGKLIHGVAGWSALVPESMAHYQNGTPSYRKATKPEPEVRLWMLEGFAAGIQPWWHHVGAYQEDRRQFRTAEPLLRWHEANQQYLVNRTPVASVGVVWSQQNIDFYGRDHADTLVALPMRGWTTALAQSRIPYLPVHIDHIDRDGANLAVLVLPHLGAMTDQQCQSVRRFVERGGHLIASGETSLYNQFGDPRADFALGDMLGIGLAAGATPSIDAYRQQADETLHSYLRLAATDMAEVYGPRRHAPAKPGTPGRKRHEVLAGFEETEILAFGGRLGAVERREGESLLTYIPEFPAYPPETAWMRTPETDIPGLVVRRLAHGSRAAYLAADLDRRYARDNLPDHRRLLANLVRWAAGDTMPLEVEGPGFIDCHLYRQSGRMVLHLVNLTNAATWRAPVEELIPVGPLAVRLRPQTELSLTAAQSLVSGARYRLATKGGWLQLSLPSILDHEVIVFT